MTSRGRPTLPHPHTPTLPHSHVSKLKTYMQLLRLPNLPTAVADVLMGFLLVRGDFSEGTILALLVGASCLIYLAGMVLNDVYDQEVDARDRPHRPIPSGRVHPGFARLLGMQMLVLGMALAWLASYLAEDWRAGLVSAGLVAMVYLYDRVLKQTPLGPAAMGACRMLNVLLGASAAGIDGTPWQAVHNVAAGGIGLYVVGVTLFARTEAQTSSRAQLTLAMLIMLLGIGLLSTLVEWPDQMALRHVLPHTFHVSAPMRWYLSWAALAVLATWRCAWAICQPTPGMVQMAVKQCILSLVVLDAAASYPAAGFIGAAVIMALLIPATTLGRWIYST